MEVSWNKKNLKLTKADSALEFGGSVPVKLQLDVFSSLDFVWFSGMGIGGFMLAASLFIYAASGEVTALPAILAGLVILLGSVFGHKTMELSYILDGEKQAITYSLKIFGFGKSGSYVSLADIVAVSVNAFISQSRPAIVWQYQVVAVTRTGKVIALTRRKRDSFNAQEKIAQNFSKLIGCPFVQPELEKNAVVRRDHAGRYSFVIEPYSTFRNDKKYFLFLIVGIAVILFLSRILPKFLF